MVDELAFRQARHFANVQSCAFGKAVLAGCCSCSLAKKHYIAERESVVCVDLSARNRCISMHQLLRLNSAFALNHIHADEPMTHAQEVKLQCGGLIGLQLAVNNTKAVADVVTLLDAARGKFGDQQMFPYSQIVQSVAAFRPRKKHTPE